MIRTILPPRTAIVTMVHNGYEYLSEFLEHHLQLCDQIFLIDHNSERDLRSLKLDGVTVIRSNHEAQFQSECTNLVIEHFDIKKNYDWLFVLDIDEFLPFIQKNEFYTYLKKHKNDHVVQLNWNNGVPFHEASQKNPESLIDCKSIRFFYKSSPHYKTCVNIRKTKGNFFVPTGAHHISIRRHTGLMKLPILNRRKRYLAAVSEFPLLHVVAFSKASFIKKIKIYIEQMKYREHVKGQGGGIVAEYPENLDDEQWLWYIANFRLTDPKEFNKTKIEYFLAKSIFEHLCRKQVIALRNKILSLNKTPKQPQTEAEKVYLRHKEDDRQIAANMAWFTITPENEIITIIRKKSAHHD